MAKHSEASYIIIKGSNGRWYHKRTKEDAKDIKRIQRDKVHLTESAYNIEEEQKLIAFDENSRGQPPLKKLKRGKNSVSFMSNDKQVSNSLSVFDEDENENITTCTSKPSKKESILSRFRMKNKNFQNASLESITDDDDDFMGAQQKSSTSNYKLNKRRDKPGVLSISEIFKKEFVKDKEQFQSYFENNTIISNGQLSDSSTSSRNEPERKPSVFNKIQKMFAKSGPNVSKPGKDYEAFKKNSTVKTKINDGHIQENKTVLEKPIQKIQIEEINIKSMDNSFPEASNLQERCKKIVSSMFLKVKSKMSSTRVPFNNKVHCNNTSSSAKFKSNIEVKDAKELSVHKLVPSIGQGQSQPEVTKGSDEDETRQTALNLEGLPSELSKPMLETNAELEELNNRISLISCKSNRNSETGKNSSDDTKTENDNEDYYYSASDETEGSISGSYSMSDIETIESKPTVPSSTEIPRKHYEKKDKTKRDKMLTKKLENLNDSEEKSRKKSNSKLSIFQKFVKIFSGKKDARKEKWPFRKLLQRLGFKKSIKTQHNNSIIMYREKRRKLFHERKEFFDDSWIAYDNVRMPIYRRSDKVIDGEMDLQTDISSPISYIIPCTVSDGVFHERKRKLGQSRIGMNELKDSTVIHSLVVTAVNSTSDIRGILKK